MVGGYREKEHATHYFHRGGGRRDHRDARTGLSCVRGTEEEAYQGHRTTEVVLVDGSRNRPLQDGG